MTKKSGFPLKTNHLQLIGPKMGEKEKMMQSESMFLEQTWSDDI